MEPGIISPDDFFRADIRVGRIVRVESFPEARKPSYKLWIDFGPTLGERRSSAQLTVVYKEEDLVGRLIVAVVNFPPRRVAGFESEVLILGVPTADDGVILLAPERDATPGVRVF